MQEHKDGNNAGNRTKTFIRAAGATVALGVGAFVASETGEDASRSVARDIETMMSTHATLSQAEWDKAVRDWYSAHTDSGDGESTWVQKKLMRESRRLGLVRQTKTHIAAKVPSKTSARVAEALPEIKISIPGAPAPSAKPAGTAVAFKFDLGDEAVSEKSPLVPAPLEPKERLAEEAPLTPAPAEINKKRAPFHQASPSFSFAGLFPDDKAVITNAASASKNRGNGKDDKKNEGKDANMTVGISGMVAERNRLRFTEDGKIQDEENS